MLFYCIFKSNQIPEFMKIPQKLIQKLNARKEQLSFRFLSTQAKGVDFYSNDYLGIAKLSFKSNLAHGATGSRLISGYSAISKELELKGASFFKQPTATLYNSGYDANIGFFSSVPQRGETVLYDSLCHASIRDGIKLGFAKSYNFKHNDIAHLTKRLKRIEGTVYVVVEAVYSMDGDEALLLEIADVCKEYGALLVVDEAHSGGIYGNSGEGLISQYGLDNQVFAKIVTFGKAFGSHGAFVLSNQIIKDYLVNFSRSLIYTTSIPPSCQAHLLFALEHTTKAIEERKKLFENIAFFKKMAVEKNLHLLPSNSPIQGVVIPNIVKIREKAERLENKGFLVKPILSPTVPEGEERIRICIHSYNTKSEIADLINNWK